MPMHVPGGAQSADACPGGPLKVKIRAPAGALKVQIRVPVGGLKVQIRVPVGALKVPIRVPVGVPESATACPGGGPSECQYVSRQGAFKLPIRSRWRPKSVQFRARLEGLD